MLICDTPKMRAYLDKLWNVSAGERSFFLRVVSQMEYVPPHLRGWTNRISRIANPALRLLAIPVLTKIDTPEVAAILESWATDTDEGVKAAAQSALEDYHERSRQAADLIAGKIKPDNLLGSQTAYVWNGQDYVPEVNYSTDE